MPQPKDKDWLNGYKNKTPIYAVYKRPTLKQMETKRKRLAEWIQKQDPYIYCLQDTYLETQDTD